VVEKKKTEEDKGSWIWLLILLGVFVAIFAALARIIYVHFKNLAVLRKYSSDENNASIRLAWYWTLAYLARYRYGISSSVSVDRIVSSEQVSNWPLDMQTHMKELAELAQLAIFSGHAMSVEEKDSAWLASKKIISAARIHSSRHKKFVVPFVRLRL
jgi:hypothetical protein